MIRTFLGAWHEPRARAARGCDWSEPVSKQTFQKKWENYWYYYKWHTLAAVFVIIVVAITARQCATRVDPDMSVALVTKSVEVPQQTCDQLAGVFQKYTADVNHDGRKVVQVYNYDLASTNPQVQEAQSAKLMADLSAGTNVIFITDSDAYAYLEKSGPLFASLNTLVPGAPSANRIALTKLPQLRSAVGDAAASKFSLSSCGKSTVAAVASGGNKRAYENAVAVLASLLKANGAVK